MASSRPSTAASAVLPCVFAAATGWRTGRFLLVFGGGGTCSLTLPVVDGSPERLAQGALECRGRTASGTMSAFAAPVTQVSSVHGGHARSPYMSQFQALEVLQGPPRDGYDPRGGPVQDNFACLGLPCLSVHQLRGT